MRTDVVLGVARGPAECHHWCDAFRLPAASPVRLASSASLGAAVAAATQQGGGSPDVRRASRIDYGGAGRSCTAWSWERSGGSCIGHLDLGHFAPREDGPGRSHGVMHGLATCSARGALQHKPVPRFMVVHVVGAFQLSPDVLARIERADTELGRTRHQYTALLVSRGDAPSHPCQPGVVWWGHAAKPAERAGDAERAAAVCAARRSRTEAEDAAAAAGLARVVRRGRVFQFGEADLIRTFGVQLLRRMGRVRWHDPRIPRWLSAGCDLPLLGWYAKAKLDASVQHVWLLQHDVGWTGLLPAILERADPTTDLICSDLGPARGPYSAS